MSHDKVTYETRTVPKHVIAVPETFTPQFGSHKLVKPRHERGKSKNPKEYELVLCRSLFKPWRNDRHNKVKTDERIHKPQMPCHWREIERQVFQVGNRLFPRHTAPCQRQKAIEHRKKHERRKYAQETMFIEPRHCCARLHGHKQKSRNHHEKRHTGSRHTAVVKRNPETVGIVSQHGNIAGKSRSIGSIKIFARMHEHHQKARHNAQIVHKYQSFFILH